MDVGPAVTAWTIRVSLAAYAAAVALACLPPPPDVGGGAARREQVRRCLWTIGAVGLFLHVLAAFHFYHGWSHGRAVEVTARETEETLGWGFGQGIFFSYLFAGAWLADVAWWWLAPRSRARRPRWATVALHAYFAFIAFNGAIVFESGPVRWFGGACLPVLAWLGFRRYRQVRRAATALATAASTEAR